MNYKAALLVPVFNGAAFARRFDQCLQLLDPKFDEVIFFDDGSKDDSAIILRALGYTVIRSEINKGPGAARNALLKHASADWVHFHDVDDLIHPGYLSETGRFINDQPDAIICDADWINEADNEILIKWEYKNSLYSMCGPSYLIKNPVGGINGLYRRSALEEIGGFDEALKIWEDSDLNLRLALHDKKISFTESVLVTAFRHVASTSGDSHMIRKFKCRFLKKHISSRDARLITELRLQANQLFHEIVYQKDWLLYDEILAIFKQLGEVPPVTNNYLLTFIKWLLGPRLFTLVKMNYLKYFHHIKIYKV